MLWICGLFRTCRDVAFQASVHTDSEMSHLLRSSQIYFPLLFLLMTAPINLFPEVFSSRSLIFFSSAVIFVSSVVIHYFSSHKPTDSMYLHSNVISHWLQASFLLPFSKEGKASRQLFLFWCYEVGWKGGTDGLIKWRD